MGALLIQRCAASSPQIGYQAFRVRLKQGRSHGEGPSCDGGGGGGGRYGGREGRIARQRTW